MARDLNRLLKALEAVLILAIDFASIFFVFKVAAFLRVEVLPVFYAGFPPEFPYRSIADIWWVFLVWIFFFSYEGLYTNRLSFWDEVRSICKASFFSSVGVFAITSVAKDEIEISRTLVVLMGAVSLPALPVMRMSAKSLLRRAGLLKRRVLILGAGETGKLVAKALRKEPNLGYEVIGYLDDDDGKVGARIDGIKVHRGVGSASKYLRRCNVTDLIIAMPGAGKERLQPLISEYQHKVDNLLFVPDIFGMAVVGTSLKHFFDEQAFALELKNNLARPLNYLTKRAFDWVVGAVLLALLIAPIAVICVLIRSTSRGPALFRQARVGKDGRTFMCYKFRTMYEDSERRLKEILDSDEGARAEWEERWKLRNDPRVTRVGNFLRATSLDELPQILNVLRGEMSLVGPRPVTGEEIEKYYKETARLYFSVLPGITGLWQVSGRSNTSYDYRIALDSWYVRNWNLWLDVVILIKTVGVVLRKEGAC